jgi:GNAT-like C-terminal domain
MTLRAEIFDLGRLQFGLYRLGLSDDSPPWYEADEAARRGPGFGTGDSCVAVHIPEGGPLEPEACDESFELARGFFAEFFSVFDQPRVLATCWSWLLDDQLAEWLPPDSNIVRFQRRFELVPRFSGGDGAMFDFIFRRPHALQHLDSLPQRTLLERAAVAHVRAGGRWRARSGWLDL